MSLSTLTQTMKHLLILPPLAFLLFGLGEGAAASPGLVGNSTCSNPQPNTCTFYPSCLESQHHCGPDGYPISYGLHFCTLSLDMKPNMSSPDGQEWVTDTILCLQDKLVPYTAAGSDSTSSCEELKEYAFETHPQCYVEGGICSLPPSDLARIVETVGLKQVFGTSEGVKTVLETGGRCAEFYGWLVLNGIVDALGGEDNGEAIAG